MFLFITEINVKWKLSYISPVTNVLACFPKLILHMLFSLSCSFLHLSRLLSSHGTNYPLSSYSEVQL